VHLLKALAGLLLWRDQTSGQVKSNQGRSKKDNCQIVCPSCVQSFAPCYIIILSLQGIIHLPATTARIIMNIPTNNGASSFITKPTIATSIISAIIPTITAPMMPAVTMAQQTLSLF
jgi:hypothetical protein